jgi:hypothetical protein
MWVTAEPPLVFLYPGSGSCMPWTSGCAYLLEHPAQLPLAQPIQRRKEENRSSQGSMDQEDWKWPTSP